MPNNYYYQTPMPSTVRQQFLGLKGRPVSSFEEARAATVDFDGSVSFFPDLANGKIYTKQCNIDGTASLNMYEIKEIPVAKETTSDINLSAYVTREEFNQALQAIKEVLQKTNTAAVAKPSGQKQAQSEEKPQISFEF